MADSKDKAKPEEDEVEETVKKQDETVPGGAYKVDGRMVNAEGEDLGKKK